MDGLEIQTKVETEARLRKISWGVARRFSLLQSRMAAAQQALARAAENEDGDALERAMERVDQAMSDIQAMIASLVIDIPRSWLVEGAPEAMDWSDAASLDWLEAARFNDLLALVAGVPQVDAAKN